MDYLSRFKSEKSVLLGIIVTKFLDWFTEKSQEYKDIASANTATQTALKKDVVRRFMATLFLRNSKQSGFGEMLVEYQKLFANKDDGHPKTIPDMINVMQQMLENKWKEI